MDGLSPAPISSGHIARLVQHICPPSALRRVPPDLLSLPLLHRHYFLAIDTDDPAAYLTWPGSDANRVLALLEQVRPDDLPDLLSLHDQITSSADFAAIRYAADPEAVYAHVRISPTSIPSSSPRLIFLWDQPSASWRYHNSAIGDFPKHAHPDLSHAMAYFHSPDDFLPERTYSFGVDDLGDEDDTYWNAYGTSDQSLHPVPVKSTPGTDTEDAYWAQYSSIQGQCIPDPPPNPSESPTHSTGSADSTIPSPRPRNHQLQPAEGDQRIFVPSTDLNPDLPHSELYNPLAPPSPNTLSRRLAILLSRPDSPPLQEEDDLSSASVSPPPQSPDAGLADPQEASGPSVSNSIVVVPAVECTAADEALKNTIKGLYQLWRSGEKSQQDFLALVKQAIEYQSL